jgi:hypothetical protein
MCPPNDAEDRRNARKTIQSGFLAAVDRRFRGGLHLKGKSIQAHKNDQAQVAPRQTWVL